MLPIIRKISLSVVLTFFVLSANSQLVTSIANGVWNDPAIWSGGVIPTSVTATQIIVDHEVVLPAAYSVSTFNLILNNRLTLSSGASLTILEDVLTSVPDLLVTGTLTGEDGAALNGTTAGQCGAGRNCGSLFIPGGMSTGLCP